MNKKITTLLLVFGLLFTHNVFSNTVMGGEITYVYLSSNTYEITLKLFRDCSGITLSTTQPVCYSSASLVSAFTHMAAQISSQPLIQNACLLPGLSACAGGTTPGVEELIYKDTVTLTGAAFDWKMSYESCCTSASTINSGTSVYLEASLNNLLAPTGSSPQFQNHALPWFCLNAPANYDFTCTDPDGDNLQYLFESIMMGNNGCPNSPSSAVYLIPYSATHPISSSTTATLSTTGLMTFTPNTIQTAIIKVRVNAIAGGGITGSVMRQNVVAVYNGIVGINEPNANPFSINFLSTISERYFTYEVNTEAGKKIRIEIYNSLGEKVYSSGQVNVNSNNVIDFAQFEGGIYFVTFTNGTEQRTEKIIKL